MALVLSNSENIDLLLFWVKLASALGAIAIALLFLFWLRLNKIENRIYKKKHLKSRLNRRTPQKTRVSTQFKSNRSENLTTAPKRSPQTQVYRQAPRSTSLKKSIKRSGNSRWLLAIAIASITGIAIALLQLGNGLISPEYTTLIWLFIGVGLVIGATYAF
ncbi:MAG: hypothetical protein LH649_09755 [Pseudanabaena sp. CAN_BIN31]|nr:hypothetical protein [Pseudanabaena sp. CAN_BIN31]